jgi:sigma-54 dependent transcriptional regulator, acetoin dehydrogenase operon transcriptional activator AcoR
MAETWCAPRSAGAGREPLACTRPPKAEPEPGMRFRRSGGRAALARARPEVSPAAAERAEISASWRRAVARGLRSAAVEPGVDASSDDGGPLARAAAEVVGVLGDDLAGTNAAVLVADAVGRIIQRCAPDRAAREHLDHVGLAPGFVWSEDHVGTNGIGTTLQRGAPTFVLGDEHFSGRLATSCSAGVPIVDERDGRALGVVAVVCRAQDATGLVMGVARHVARDIERSLRAQLTTRRQLLRESFARAGRHASGALAAVSPDLILTNAAAARVLTADDRAALWEWVLRAPDRNAHSLPVPLASGLVGDVSSAPIYDGAELIGALIGIAAGDTDAPATSGTRPATSATRFGWSSLTDAELGIAEHVAAGRTNREVAALLFVSPHTVDSHLRHIYTKLGIGSRVQLTRVFMSHHAATA